jgi:hypothetical protein
MQVYKAVFYEYFKVFTKGKVVLMKRKFLTNSENEEAHGNYNGSYGYVIYSPLKAKISQNYKDSVRTAQ